jgi:hypothetical protein
MRIPKCLWIAEAMLQLCYHKGASTACALQRGSVAAGSKDNWAVETTAQRCLTKTSSEIGHAKNACLSLRSSNDYLIYDD